jgi:hypothetical protein
MALDFITPTTELEAVNAILRSVGESPVNALNGDFVDAEIGRNILTEESRAVQSQSWNFNTELAYPLTPDAEGRIFVPQNTLRFIYPEDTNVIQRGLQLYNRETHSYTFTEAVTATIVVALSFDLIPEPLRRFLAIRAGRLFQDMPGQSDQIVHQFKVSDERAAWASFLNYDAEMAGYNVLTNNALLRRLKGMR